MRPCLKFLEDIVKQTPFTPARRLVPANGATCQSAALTWVVEPRNDGGRRCIFDGDLTNSDQPVERRLPQHQSSASDAAVSLRGGVPGLPNVVTDALERVQ